jgi:hypothetical protein
VLATLLWGGVVMLLISGSMVQLVRKHDRPRGLPLVVLSLLWLSWQFLSLAQEPRALTRCGTAVAKAAWA